MCNDNMSQITHCVSGYFLLSILYFILHLSNQSHTNNRAFYCKTKFKKFKLKINLKPKMILNILVQHLDRREFKQLYWN